MVGGAGWVAESPPWRKERGAKLRRHENRSRRGSLSSTWLPTRSSRSVRCRTFALGFRLNAPVKGNGSSAWGVPGAVDADGITAAAGGTHFASHPLGSDRHADDGTTPGQRLRRRRLASNRRHRRCIGEPLRGTAATSRVARRDRTGRRGGRRRSASGSTPSVSQTWAGVPGGATVPDIRGGTARGHQARGGTQAATKRRAHGCETAAGSWNCAEVLAITSRAGVGAVDVDGSRRSTTQKAHRR